MNPTRSRRRTVDRSLSIISRLIYRSIPKPYSAAPRDALHRSQVSLTRVVMCQSTGTSSSAATMADSTVSSPQQSLTRQDVFQQSAASKTRDTEESTPSAPSEQIGLEPHQYSAAIAFPEGGRKAWLVVFSSFCLIAATFGLTSSIGLFQSHWQSHQLSDYSSQDISWISSTQVFLTLFLGVQIGPLFDRYGPRWLTFVGSVGCVAYLLLLGQCTEYWQFLLCFGVLGGTSGAILTTVALSVISHWFHARRGLATGITFTGTSLGGIVFPIALRSILDHMSWAWSMRLLALFVFVLVLFGNLFIRGRMPKHDQGGVINVRSFRDARFAWTTAGISCFEFVLFTAIGLLPTYALEQGFGRQTSFNVIAILNAGSGLGRYIAGLVADHYGRFNSMTVSILISLFATLALWLPANHSIALFYVMVPIFGFGSGSVMSLAPVCIGELCKVSEYGQRYGTSYSVVGIATLISIPIAAQLQASAGTTAFVAFSGGMLVLALLSFLMARWACLGYKWQGKVKI